MLSIVFRVDEWSGSLSSETDETHEAQFFDLNHLPDIPALYQETLNDLQQYAGRLITK